MKWHPVSEPPAVPMGSASVRVIVERDNGSTDSAWFMTTSLRRGFYGETWAHIANVVRWCYWPTPPRDGQPDPVDELIAAARGFLGTTEAGSFEYGRWLCRLQSAVMAIDGNSR